MVDTKMIKIYVDTNVYLDYLKNRSNKFGKPLGEDAWRVFARVLNGKFQLVVSSFVLEELYRQIEPTESALLFEIMKENVIPAIYSSEEKMRAKTLNPDHWQDALHAIIANREKVDYLVTQNFVDYIPYSALVNTVRPKEI
ncbi:PIN domain-containing protein [Candidatus Micrarchaeota archaeon]|nr:PIN domain-containing protein [Candidatus Micrarchaeota archaeon]